MAHGNGEKVKEATIRTLDDGTFIYSVRTEKKNDKESEQSGMPTMGHYEYAFDSVDDLSEVIASDFGMKMPKKKEPDLSSLRG